MIKFRDAVIDDCDLIFKWSNDPVSREQSFSSEPIPYQAHKEWFKKKLQDPGSHLLIFHQDNEEVGLIRLDKTGDEWIISVNLEKKFRGMGLAVRMIEIATEHILQQDLKSIAAFIKPDNIASIKVFQKAGYKKTDQNLYNGHLAYKYVYNK